MQCHVLLRAALVRELDAIDRRFGGNGIRSDLVPIGDIYVGAIAFPPACRRHRAFAAHMHCLREACHALVQRFNHRRTRKACGVAVLESYAILVVAVKPGTVLRASSLFHAAHRHIGFTRRTEEDDE